MAQADFVATGGILGAASLRVGMRRLLDPARRRRDAVTDREAEAFVASLAPGPRQAVAGTDESDPAREREPSVASPSR